MQNEFFFLTESENVAGVLSFLEARQTWVHFSRICRTGCTADESSRGDPRWLGAQRLLEFIFARRMSSEHTRFFVASDGSGPSFADRRRRGRPSQINKVRSIGKEMFADDNEKAVY